MNKVINKLILAAILYILFSCAEERLVSLDGLSKDDAQIVLHLKTQSDLSKTRAYLTFTQENKIDDIYVLAFDSYYRLKTIKPGLSVTSTPGHTNPLYSGSGSFMVVLMASSSPLDKYNLVVLANAKSILTATIGIDATSPYIDQHYSTVRSAIWTAISDKMYNTPTNKSIAMWGETGPLLIEAGNADHTLELTRAIARIDVGIGNPAYDPTLQTWSWDGLDADNNPIPFKLGHVYVVRPSNRYAVIPDMSALAAGNPTLPTGTTLFSVSESESKFGYVATVPATGGSYVSQDIYTPESDIKITATGKSGDLNHTNRTALVIGGYYNGSLTETFYRIDIAPGKNLANLLRNHLYLISITSASGPGFPTVEIAYESLAFNMTVDIFDWDQTVVGDIFFDGVRYVSLERARNEKRDERIAVLYRNIGSTDVMVFKTNIPLSEFEMELNHGGDFPDPLDKTVIENNRFKVEIKTDPSGITYFEFTALLAFDATATDNPSILTVTAGRIKFDITIIQLDDDENSWIEGGEIPKTF